MPDIEDIGAAVGLACVTVGVCLVFVPAGLVVLGTALIVGSFLRARKAT